VIILLPQIVDFTDSLSRRVSDPSTGSYFVMYQIFRVISILGMIAILLFTFKIAFCDCGDARKRLLSLISVGILLLFVLMWAIMRFTIPVEGLETLPAQWVDADRTLFMIFRFHTMQNLVLGAILVLITCLPYLKREKGEKKEKPAKKEKAEKATETKE